MLKSTSKTILNGVNSYRRDRLVRVLREKVTQEPERDCRAVEIYPWSKLFITM